jgi:hypothetical protein
MSTSSNPVHAAAPELSKHASEIRRLCKRVYNDIVEIGERLLQAKSLIGHGDWLGWIDRELHFSPDTAQRFIDVAEGDKFRNLRHLADLHIPISAIYLLARPQTPSEAIEAVEERSRRGERLGVRQIGELVTEHKIIARGNPRESVAPSPRAVPLAAFAWPERTTTHVQLDNEFAAAQHLIIAMEGYYRSATDAKMAKLGRAATEICRDRAAIRRIAEAIIDALDAHAGPLTGSEAERRIAERRT